MAKKIEVLVMRPGEKAVTETHGEDLESQQAIVGGYIEMVSLGGDLAMFCNEEGKLKNLPPNFVLVQARDIIMGTVFFCRLDGEGGCESLTASDIKNLKRELVAGRALVGGVSP